MSEISHCMLKIGAFQYMQMLYQRKRNLGFKCYKLQGQVLEEKILSVNIMRSSGQLEKLKHPNRNIDN